MKFSRSLLLLSGIVAIAAASAASPSAPPPSPAIIAAGRTAFVACSVCHAIVPGKNGLGPSLAGVVGRPVASVAGFAYSPALKAQKGAWTREKIDAFIAAPQQTVPGTKMIYPGQPDAAKRAAIVAYLTTLK